MDTFIGMLLHTPWWVYLAFAYVIYAGLKAMRPRRVSFVRLLVPPAIFTVVSAFNVIGRMGDHVLYITPWSLAAAAGVAVGWLHTHRLDLVADRENHCLEIPGSAVNLLLFLFFFGAQYYYGFTKATDPARLKEVSFIVFFLMVSGLSAGIMWARGLSYYLAYTGTAPAEAIG